MCGSCRTRGEERKIRRGSRRLEGFVAVVAVLMLASSAPATRAENPPLPWAGGAAVETQFELFVGQLAGVIAGRPVKVICNDAGEWSALSARQRLDAVTVWGFVLFDFEPSSETYRPGDTMQLAEAPCSYLDQYWRAPASEKGKTCRVASQLTFRPAKTTVRVTKRVKVRGTWRTRVAYVTKVVQVPVEVPKYGACPDYLNRVFALQTISHESQHLAGIRDEATAECNGMQKLSWFAQHFGATAEQGAQMAGDYYREVYLLKRPGTPYYLSTCPDPSR
jgi:hypothetical protein